MNTTQTNIGFVGYYRFSEQLAGKLGGKEAHTVFEIEVPIEGILHTQPDGSFQVELRPEAPWADSWIPDNPQFDLIRKDYDEKVAALTWWKHLSELRRYTLITDVFGPETAEWDINEARVLSLYQLVKARNGDV